MDLIDAAYQAGRIGRHVLELERLFGTLTDAEKRLVWPRGFSGITVDRRALLAVLAGRRLNPEMCDDALTACDEEEMTKDERRRFDLLRAGNTSREVEEAMQ